MKRIIFETRYLVLWLLRLYQNTLSFDHGPMKWLFSNGFCRFHPTCSEYAIRVIEKYGIIQGGVRAVWRVMRCNPFSKGGMDEP